MHLQSRHQVELWNREQGRDILSADIGNDGTVIGVCGGIGVLELGVLAGQHLAGTALTTVQQHLQRQANRVHVTLAMFRLLSQSALLSYVISIVPLRATLSKLMLYIVFAGSLNEVLQDCCDCRRRSDLFAAEELSCYQQLQRPLLEDVCRWHSVWLRTSCMNMPIHECFHVCMCICPDQAQGGHKSEIFRGQILPCNADSNFQSGVKPFICSTMYPFLYSICHCCSGVPPPSGHDDYTCPCLNEN